MTIYICGLPRTGKTTLARMLHKSLPNSSLIVTEAIRNAFQKINPAESHNWGNKNSEFRQKVFPEFVKELLIWNEKFSQSVTILDCALLGLKQVQSIAKEKDLVIYLGFGGMDNKQAFQVIREYEMEEDYTKKYSDENLLKLWDNLSVRDKANIQFCQEHNLKYYNTSKNRTAVQEEIVKYILKELNIEKQE